MYVVKNNTDKKDHIATSVQWLLLRGRTGMATGGASVIPETYSGKRK